MEDTAFHKSITGVIAKSNVEGGFEGYASTWYNIDHHRLTGEPDLLQFVVAR